MKLSEVLTESAVLLDPQAGDKWQLIELLTDSLVASGQIEADSRDPVHEALLGRERSMSTGMEHGLAIPHKSEDQVDKTAVALGICRAGIDFEAIDDRPTHLVILLVNPSNRTKAHIRTLAEIARLLSNADLRTALHEAPSAQVALEKIREAEAAVT